MMLCSIFSRVIIDNIVYAYLVPTVALLVLLVILKVNHLFSKKQTRLFLFAVLINLFMIAITAADVLFSHIPKKPFNYLRSITTFLNFAAGPLVPMFLFHIFNKVKHKIYMYIPFLINVILCFISLFCNLVFDISETNGYARGPLFIVPFVISIFYTLLIVAYPCKNHREGRAKERAFIIFLVLFLFACLLLETLLYFRCLLYAASAIGLVLYYVLQNILYFMTDPLTGVYNRQMYHHELEKTLKLDLCYIALADVNGLKQINDTLGHEAGDRALIAVSKALYDHSYTVAHLYRIGGDEFVLISKNTTKEVFCKHIEDALNEVKKSGYSFAWGIGEYRLGEDLQEIINSADAEMYEKKKLAKAKAAELSAKEEPKII